MEILKVKEAYADKLQILQDHRCQYRLLRYYVQENYPS